MLSSVLMTLLMIALLFVPGLFLLSIGRKWIRHFSWYDTVAAAVVLSGFWNFLFFIPRMLPETRLETYVIATSLIGVVAITTGTYSLGSWKSFFVRNKKTLGLSLLTLVLGIVLLGYPYHSQNLSRLQPNPDGGDVNLFLFKSHLHYEGYGVHDDLYVGEVAFYPSFFTTNVALTTLFSGTGMALHAETFRVIVIVLIFCFIVLLGKGLRLSDTQSLLFGILSISTYHLWSHLDYYVPVGMAFMLILPYFYFVIRGFATKHLSYWFCAGIAASLILNSHPVHGLFIGTFSLLMLGTHLVLNRNHIQKAVAPIATFVLSAAPLALSYLIPIAYTYRFQRTSTYHKTEVFNTTYTEFALSLVNIPSFFIALVFCLFIAYRWYTKKPFMPSFAPAALFYLSIFPLVVAFRFLAIHIHLLPLYIDVADYFTLIQAFAWFFSIIAGIVLISYALGLSHKRLLNQKSWIVVFVATLGLTLYPSVFSRYTTQIWSHTQEPAAVGVRAENGNIPGETWNRLAAEVIEKVPVYESALFTSPAVAHSFHSLVGRQLVAYAPPHSNLYITPSPEERVAAVNDLFTGASLTKWTALIERLGITHILWTGADATEMLHDLRKMPNLQEIKLRHNDAALFTVITP